MIFDTELRLMFKYTDNDIRQAVILLSLHPASLTHKNPQRHKIKI